MDITKSDGLTFEQWMGMVDSMLIGICGLTSNDLPDASWHDEYSADSTPREAIENNNDYLEIPSELLGE